MQPKSPSVDDVRDAADALGFDLDAATVEAYRGLMERSLRAYETVAERAPAVESPPADRASERVGGDEFNAWVTRCTVAPTGSGTLDGWTLAVKDNVAVAGVELTCGSRVFEGYVPPRDATVVDRVLAAGGEIVGKTNMDDLALGSSGHTSAFGATLNARDPDLLAGGSSGGSATVVATGAVDAALGTDQAGSVRIPAAWSGVVGLKPTHGLVPYTGAVGLDPTVDHVGALAGDVPTVATLLSVLAGRDGLDARQPRSIPSTRYEDALDVDPSSLAIAVVEEGFGRREGEAAVDDAVSGALDALSDAGATVTSASVPLQADARDVYSVCSSEGFLATVRGEGVGHNHGGWYDCALVEAFGDRRRDRADDLPPTAVLSLLLGSYADDALRSRYYAMAMNLRRSLAAAYDDLLDNYDLVALPTTPQRATRHDPMYDDATADVEDGTADRNGGRREATDLAAWLGRAWPNMANTCTFNMTGHPAVSVPVAVPDDRPVGAMLVGDRFADDVVLAGAHLLETVQD